jgi:hypothetical protein
VGWHLEFGFRHQRAARATKNHNRRRIEQRVKLLAS